MKAAPLHLIITLTGPDRPGLIESLSTVISESGGNWEEARMARLSGQFAGVVRATISQDKADPIKKGLEELDREDNSISVTYRETGGDSAPASAPGSEASVHVVGQDRSGIVKEISQVLARLKVNVEELVTECESAPMSGERLFHLDAEVVLPQGVSEEDVESELEEIAQDLVVTIVSFTE